jgi:MoaA/NifB/PqqE/SkfB family radical SAM enzyme
LIVWPNGDVKPCREWVVGNVNQTPAMEVWNGEKFRSFRRLLAERGTLPICARCCYMAYRYVFEEHAFWQLCLPPFSHSFGLGF